MHYRQGKAMESYERKIKVPTGLGDARGKVLAPRRGNKLYTNILGGAAPRLEHAAVIGAIQPNGDIFWSHGYISRKER